MSYSIFLDDERHPPKNSSYNIVRSYKEFCNLIDTLGIPEFISFDHDLGEDKTGLDCAKYIVDYCLNNNVYPDFNFVVHSQNPVGKENIEGLINNFKEVVIKASKIVKI